MKKYAIFLGNYGSGKTELAINAAIKATKTKQAVALVDMDIINPYFRSSEKQKLLKANGISLIASDYVRSNVDLPIIPAEIHQVFSNLYDAVIFDVGGDVVGATVLGAYWQQFDALGDELGVYYVINARRPLSNSAERIVPMLHQIQGASRRQITGLINNTNLANQTEAEDIIAGQAVVCAVAEQMEIPILYTSGWQGLLQEAQKEIDIKGEAWPIETVMRPNWL